MIEELLTPGLALAGRRVVVLGLAVTGRAVARVLAARGAAVLVSEERRLGEADLSGLGGVVEVETGGHQRAATWLSSADFVVPSPGISPRTGFLAEVVASGVPIVSELDLAARLTQAPIVAVTGTNGKTTVCRLAERIARESGWRAFACGNTEVPFLAAAHDQPDADLFVVEASSFRLAFCELFAPRVAVITNLAPDHLDWHGTFAQYRESKGRIAARQTPGDLFLYPYTDPDLASLAPADGPRVAAFAQAPFGMASGAWVEGGEVVVAIGERPVRAPGAGALAERGAHFAEDIAAAAAAMVFCGARGDAVRKALGGFSLDPHRMEPVGALGGVRFVDDSKATNTHATLAALRQFDRVVLIAGGRNREGGVNALAAEASRLRMVVALGEAAGEIEDVFSSAGVGVRSVGSMKEAVAVALETASPGDVVLLSPACASLDMFSSYAERGRAFRDACRDFGVIPRDFGVVQ